VHGGSERSEQLRGACMSDWGRCIGGKALKLRAGDVRARHVHVLCGTRPHGLCLIACLFVRPDALYVRRSEHDSYTRPRTCAHNTNSPI
jgi:hypothetical protein